MSAALVCVAKEEDRYLGEWIDYHLKLGFDRIFVYQNDWRYKGPVRPEVTLEVFDGLIQQINTYNRFLDSYGSEYEWVAFMDVDEFLCLKRHANVTDFLKNYRDHVAINWVLFGSSGLPDTGELGVLRRFVRRQVGVDKNIKSIVKVHPQLRMRIHRPVDILQGTHFENIAGVYNPDGDDSIAQVNHYFCKTRQEYKLKQDRGRADSPRKRFDTDFAEHDRNDIEDTIARDFLYVGA